MNSLHYFNNNYVNPGNFQISKALHIIVTNRLDNIQYGDASCLPTPVELSLMVFMYQTLPQNIFLLEKCKIGTKTSKIK